MRRTDPDGIMDAVGGLDWWMSEERAYQQWLSGQAFFTKVGEHVAEVVRVTGKSGRHYLRTRSDSVLANNLGVLARASWRRYPEPIAAPPRNALRR